MLTVAVQFANQMYHAWFSLTCWTALAWLIVWIVRDYRKSEVHK